MKNPLRLKKTLCSLALVASLPVIVQTASAQVLFSDNYTATSNQTPNDQITNPGRQGGPLAPLGYIQTGNVQIGNTGTLPIDPGDVSAGDSFLAAFGGTAYVNYDFSVVTGPLEVDFKGLISHIGANGDLTTWVSFNVGNGAGAPFVTSSDVCAILFRANGGTELWNQGANTDFSGAFAPGFDAWTSYKVILSDTAGTGSAFVGNGTRADYYSNGSFIGTFNMNQLGTGQGFIGFSGSDIVGYDNVTISGTLPAVVAPVLATDIEPLQSEVTTGQPLTLSVHVTGTPLGYQWYNQNGAIGGATTNSYTFTAVAGTNTYYVIVTNSAGSVTSSTASVISAADIVTVNNYSFENGGSSFYGNGELPTGWSAFNASGNWAGLGTSSGGFAAADGNTYLAINTIPSSSGPSGVYQDVGALLPNTTYTLTVAIGRSTAAGVPPNGVGDWSPGIISLLNGTDSTGALLATTTGYPGVVGTWQDYTATFSTGPAASGDLVVTLSDAPANTYQATFDNVRLTQVVSVVPLPTRIQDVSPASAVVALGSNAVFTAAYSNSPPVSLQWQQLVSGVTNNINTGVVNVTSNGVVYSTLTLNNVQLAASALYRLQAVNATNSAGVVDSGSASLTVVPLITWYAAGAYNYTFSDDTVLALAGSVANEVYGVDFGGSGPQTTANGYSFDDYDTTGNMSVVSTGLGIFQGYLSGATTGDSAFDTILEDGVRGSSANTATLNNLTVGQTYTVMVLLDDTESSPAGTTFHVTDGLTVSPVQPYAFADGTPAIGGYIMGTFTAAATTQPLSVFLNNGNAQYNAVLLEKGIAAPPTNAPILLTDVSPLLAEITTGGSVTLSVAAAGSVPLHYQWSTQSGPISGATSPGYTFNAVAGTNSYSVIVTNSSGSVTSSVAVVISSPSIVTVNNFSFQNQILASGATDTLTPNGPAGWTGFNVGSGGNYDIGITYSASGTDFTTPLTAPALGNNYLWINRFNGNGTQVAGVYQDVGILLANTTYTLTVAIGQRGDAAPNNQPSWSPGIISLLNGTSNTGIVLASTNGIPSTPDSWQDYTVSFTTGAAVSGDLTVELSVLDASAIQADFSNVRLTKAAAPVVIAPTIGPVRILGGNLILTGTGGTANAPYIWLTTTNLAAPITWTTNSTGTLDANGGFSNAIPVSASQKASFFKLLVQ
jgi:hypothetical protein